MTHILTVYMRMAAVAVRYQSRGTQLRFVLGCPPPKSNPFTAFGSGRNPITERLVVKVYIMDVFTSQR